MGVFMINVLLVEDDVNIAEIITHYLNEAGEYEVSHAVNAQEAFALGKQSFDIILMDVVLPDGSGINVCERLRETHSCPIIFLSALDDSDTIVKALEMGGDDYLTKPFDNKVLIARVQANLRRAKSAPQLIGQDTLSCAGFTLNAISHMVERDGEGYPLASIEYQLLCFLMQHPNQYFTAAELYKRIWGKDSFGDVRTVLVHIHNIRRKIETDYRSPRFLRNTAGRGYIFYPSGVAQ